METPVRETSVETPAPAPIEEIKKEETPVKKESETETVAPRDLSPRVIRRIRRISRTPERPIRRRIIKRRRPVERNEEEIEEIIEYIDEEPGNEEAGEVYDEYENDDGYEYEDVDDDDYEDDYEEDIDYREEQPRRPQPRIEGRPPHSKHREKPSANEERPSPPPEKKKPLVPYRPAPTVRKPKHYPEEELGFENEDDVEEAILSDDDKTVDDSDAGYEDEVSDEDEEYGSEDKEDEDAWDSDEADEEELGEVPAVILEPSLVLTVEDIISAYETDPSQADARFVNKILRVTGVISRVDVRIPMSVYALELEGEETHPLRQTLRCVFNREHGEILQSFVPAREVTVQGKFDGSIISITMRDCLLIGGGE